MSTTKSSRVVRVAASSVICVALALGTTGVALAGQGPRTSSHSSFAPHDHGHSWNSASGVVTALGTNSITLKGRHGTSTTYTTASATTYFEGSTAGAIDDLVVGESVNLSLSATSPQTVSKVTIDLVGFFGTVTTVVGNVITIGGFHGSTLTIDVSASTTYTSGGAASTLAAVVVGAEIIGWGLPGTTAGSINANTVNIKAPRLQTHASGVVTALGTNSVTLKDHKGTSTTFTTTSATTYFEGSAAGVVGDLAVGESVNFKLTSTAPQTVTKVTICLARVSGAVTAVAGNVITISAAHDTAFTVNVSASTTYTSAGAASTLAAVVVGAQISAVGLSGSPVGTLNADGVNIAAPRLQDHADGVVTALGTGSITLNGRHGASTAFTTTSATTYFEGATVGVVGDLAVGESVNLKLTSTAPQTVTKVTIDLVGFFGSVKTVAGNVITISGFHGSTITVDVSGSTTYTSAGAASTLAAVVVGTVITGRGLPGTTAGTINANSVNIGVAFGHGHTHSQGHSSRHGSGRGKSTGRGGR